MPMDYVIDIFYGKEISKEDAENHPIKDLGVTVHKLKVPKDNFEYLQGVQLKIVYTKLRESSNIAILKDYRSFQIKEIPEGDAKAIINSDVDKVEGYKYYACGYIW